MYAKQLHQRTHIWDLENSNVAKNAMLDTLVHKSMHQTNDIATLTHLNEHAHH